VSQLSIDMTRKLLVAVTSLVITATPAISDETLKYCESEHSYALSLAKKYLDFRINGGDLCDAAEVSRNLQASREILKYDCDAFFEKHPYFSIDTFYGGKNMRELDDYRRQAQDKCDDWWPLW
jgi:hypothetical protein